MASPALQEQWQAERAKREATGYKPVGYQAPDTDQRIFGVRITSEDEQKGFGRKILEDGALLAYGALTGAAKLGEAALSLPFVALPGRAGGWARENVKETTSMMWTGLKQTGKDIGGAVGLLGEEAQKESLDYYKAHPLMALMDVWGVASLGTGTLLKSGMNNAAKSSIDATVRAATNMGIKEAVVREAFEVGRFMASPLRVASKTKIASPFEIAFYKAIKTGTVDDVAASITGRLTGLGVNTQQAVQLGKIAADDVAKSIIRNSSRLKTLNALTHPISASSKAVGEGVKKITGSVLGKTDEAAVTSLFGADIVNANKKTALGMEQWLEAVASERGWDNTIDNRMRILQEIKGKQDFVNLAPDEFFQHFDNYVRADENVARLRAMTNNSSFIPVRTISKESAESMAETLDNMYDALETDAQLSTKIGVENIADRTFVKVSDFMTENFGRDWKNYEVQLRRAYGNGGKAGKTRLANAVAQLSEQMPHLEGAGWSEASRAIIQDMKSTGYQIGFAPTDKKVSLASEVMKSATDKGTAITNATLASDRTFLGKVIDSWGLSPRGVVEGTAQFQYRQSWVQHAMKDLAGKYGQKIKINRPDTGDIGIRKITIPVERLYQWLDEHRRDFDAQRSFGMGVLPQFRIRTVFDITKKDLEKMGFPKDVAKDIVSISKRSMREIPASVVGLGDKLVNILRSSDNHFGRFYDNWMLKTSIYLRYQSPLSIMFQGQQYVETKIMTTMLTKNASALPGVEAIAKLSNFIPEKKIGGIVESTKNYLQKITAEPTLNELSITRDELLTDVAKTIDDLFGATEFQSVVKGVEGARKATETGAELFSKTQKDALWLRVFGGFHLNTGTKIAKAMSEKFGLSLKQLVEKNPDGAYVHGRLVREVQDSIRSILTYQHGFQTSPLAKTMNLIWFPFKFQVKTIQMATKWLSELQPLTRAAVVNNWVHFSSWAGSDEGLEWRKKHQSTFYSILAYTTAYEQIGDTLDAVGRGQLFGGNAGLIGGLPFGFFYNLASELALIPEDPEQFDPVTGKSFRFKKVPKELISYGSFVTALEELVFQVLPGMPLYTVTGGVIRGASYRHWWEEKIGQAAAFGISKIEGVESEFGQKLLEREFMRIRPGETRW